MQGRNVVSPWDQANTDVDRVMQLIMFYGAAKGRAYTRLEHRYQRVLDWSDHVTPRQAILWGRSRAAGADILLDDKAVSRTEDWTYCRVLIPVAPPGEA